MSRVDGIQYVKPRLQLLKTIGWLTLAVTHQSASPKWIKRVSKTKVRLADVQLYVFCQEYRQHNQRRGAAGAFEICFVSEEGKFGHPDSQTISHSLS